MILREIASSIEALHNAVGVSVCLSIRENKLYTDPREDIIGRVGSIQFRAVDSAALLWSLLGTFFFQGPSIIITGEGMFVRKFVMESIWSYSEHN